MKILLDTYIFLWFILFKEIAVLYRQAVRLLRQVNADEERVILTFDRTWANSFIAGGCDRQ